MGRGDAVHLLSADSQPAVRAAAADWDALVRSAGGAVEAWGSAAAPATWTEAADRLMTLILAAQPGVAHRAAGPAPPRAHPPTRALAADGKLPAEATSKLIALRSDAGEAGRRAADAAVLEPLTALAFQRREWLTQPAAGPVPALARMNAEPGYGDAVWAVVDTEGSFLCLK
eukprot:3342743-Pleurochrysis_carterae.AAC.1